MIDFRKKGVLTTDAIKYNKVESVGIDSLKGNQYFCERILTVEIYIMLKIAIIYTSQPFNHIFQIYDVDV